MAKDTWTIIGDRMKSLSDLNKRMDDTAKLLLWDDNPYELVKPDGTTKLRDSISVTPNLPKVFAHGVVSDLLGGKWQTVVEGDISGKRAHSVESFVEDNFAQADELLLNRHGIPSLFGFLCNHVCVRWAIGVRWISEIIDGEYKVDCLPVDMRWTPFEFGNDGYNWVAPIFFRSKGELEKQYPDASISGTTDIEVRDYWDSEKHEVWIDKKLVLAENHTLGRPPFVIVIPATGFMLRDKGYLKHEGEDILFLNAGLYTELARSISLEQTSGYAGLYPAYEYETANPDGKPSEPVPKLDETLKRKTGERHIPVPRGDINRAGQTARVDIQDMIGAGAPLSPRQYNTPPSAILLAGETEMIARLQNARKDALGICRSQLARLMIEQYTKADKGGAEILIGKRGKRSKYSTSELGNPDDYTITYHLSVKSKRQELANLTEFAVAYGKLPLKWNLTNVLMVDDPDGVIKDLEIEEAERADPAIKLAEMGIRYAEEAERMEDADDKELRNFQSKLLIERAVSIIKERMQPVQPTMPALPEKARVPTVEQPTGNTQLLSAAAKSLAGEVGRPPVPPQEVTR